MSCSEAQEEEIEVLRSIYDGDEQFKEVSETVFQYKFGEDGDHKSFLLEISWGENYPEEQPTINMNTFYNKHILNDVKTSVVEKVKEQAMENLETAMTYTLFEYVKENVGELVENQPDSPQYENERDSASSQQMSEGQSQPKVKERKEQLTKAQKRKQINRCDATGEYPRGYEWVDIIKHLSQIGSQNMDS